MEMKVWLWLKKKTIDRALEALLRVGDDEHQKARECDGAEADEHRAEAEEFHAAKHDLWSTSHEKAMRDCSDDSVHGNSAPTQITRIAPQIQKVEISERTLTVLAFSFAIASFVTALWSIHESDRSARETRQLQIQVMDMNALALRNGWLLPRDLVYGPAGNLEYKPKENR